MLTDAQREQRRQAITGTDIAAICGISPWKTPLEVYYEKKEENISDDTENRFMRWGNRLEAVIAQAYEEENLQAGQQLYPYEGTLVHPQYDFLRGTPDYGLSENGTTIGLVEIKSASTYQSSAFSDGIPFYYITQVAWYRLLSQLAYVDVAVLIGGNDFRVFRYEPREDLEKQLIQRARRFYEDHILADVPPEPANLEDIKKLYRTSQAEAIVADNDVLDTLSAYIETENQMKALQEQNDQRKLAIMSYMKNADTLLHPDGRKLISWKASKPVRRFSTTAFRKAHPELYDEFKETGNPMRPFKLLIKETV